jgi:hypothetical protein
MKPPAKPKGLNQLPVGVAGWARHSLCAALPLIYFAHADTAAGLVDDFLARIIL